MSKKNTINEEMLAIVKALSEKVEALEKTIYAKDSLLMKAGLVISETPSPAMDNTIGGSSGLPDITNMDWSEIHKMMEKVGGQ
jgi:hypothetical protein|tara:strand:+ start:950 stop:1198 length:249 start_codon:yes stop_codon:yes gene_type:complete